MATLLIFGDSITAGMWDREGGWADRIKNYFNARSINSNFDEYNEVYNLGKSGDTTVELLNRFEHEVKARIWDDPNIVIIIAIGINDSVVVNNTNKVEILAFKENLHSLLDIAHKYSEKIIFVGLTPVVEVKVNPMPWSLKEAYSNNDIEKYNHVLKEFCEKQNIMFVDVFEKLSQSSLYLNSLHDGVHPVKEGHILIYEDVLEVVSTLLDQ